MVNKEILQPAEEAEEDQERIHIKDWTLELKTSSRLQKEKAVQLIHFAASKKYLSVSSVSTYSKRRMVTSSTQTNTKHKCMNTQSSSI